MFFVNLGGFWFNLAMVTYVSVGPQGAAIHFVHGGVVTVTQAGEEELRWLLERANQAAGAVPSLADDLAEFEKAKAAAEKRIARGARRYEGPAI